MTGLPANVKTGLQTSGHMGHQLGITSVRANIASCNNILRHSAVRQADEMGPASAAAVAKILALPKVG